MEGEYEGSSGSTRMCNDTRMSSKATKNMVVEREKEIMTNEHNDILLSLRDKISMKLVDQTYFCGLYEKPSDKYQINSMRNRPY